MVLRASRELAGRFVVATRYWSVRAEWLWLTAGGALLLTTADSFLLERKYGLFRGGYLAADYLDGPLLRWAFLVVSLSTDAALLGLAVWLVLAVASRLPLSAAARGFVVLGAALAPFVVADVLFYQIADFLGDLVNLSTLYDLGGRSPRELWAIAGPHVLKLSVAFLVGAGGVALLAWIVNRRWPHSPFPPAVRMKLRRLALPATLLLVVGTFLNAVGRSGSAAVDAGLARKPAGQVLGRIVRAVTDVDRDGSGLLSRPRDPDPWDARVRPYAVEVPGNGVDENGVAGDLPASVPPYREGPREAPRFAFRPPVVFVILETFRADLLERRLGGREATPVLNALARSGVSSQRAYSHNGFTIQSRYHIFTGSLAGVRGRSSLIDDFNANGYETAFFSAQDESFGSHMDVGFERAHVRYDARQDVDRRFSQFTSPGSLGVPWNVLVERTLAYLSRRSADRPLFLHLNFQDTHFPYHNCAVKPLLDAPVVSRGDIDRTRAAEVHLMYTNTAANVDRALGEILGAVQRSTGQEPAVIALGDHGESFFDDGLLGHGVALTDVQTRIPLVVSRLPMEIAEPFGQTDLRDLIWGALAREPTSHVGPTMRPTPGKVVVQYVGGFRAPEQLGFRSLEGQWKYDFLGDVGYDGQRSYRTMSRKGGPARLTDLLHYWEAAVVALAGRP